MTLGPNARVMAKDSPRRLIVLRHGETSHNAAGIWQGQLDSPLSQQGVEQAVAAARALAAFGPVRVVASDLSRARVTGETVARVDGIPLTTDERFREIHAGAWQGLTGEQVRAGYPEDMDRLLRGDDFKRGGHGESVADVAARCRAGVDALLVGLEAGECAVIATHGVAGRALAADLVGLDQRTAWIALGGLGNCHWAELVEGRAGWRIHTWNQSAAASLDAHGPVA
ncbi:histidine phosphatase family protein [Knoellia aerolata]|uniref:Phosphoglycerate mutase n=1 Tax=Knoellia aerolata DSM 18566 TaxID=1385519 RepID=A0A0A0JUX9_9MICO|nr:histidine phosphatase family protein [Knoellia aerolata]KGN39892.1 phosphoglycerate mutase [Knoellia aerolata DSM 18566]